VNLAALLEHVGTYLDDRGSGLISGDPDSLWPDATIVRFLNEAQRIIARRAWVIIEYGVAPAGVIVLATDKSVYPLHKSILRVYDATPSVQTAPLGRGEDIRLRDTSLISGGMNEAFAAWEIGNAAALAGATTNVTGTTLAFATDSGTRTLRVYPGVSTTENGTKVYMKVARLPITWLTLDDTAASPEVPEDYHDSLVLFAAGRALTLPNVDSQSKGEGRELLDEFDKQCKKARQDRQRAEMSSSRWSFSSVTAVLGRGA